MNKSSSQSTASDESSGVKKRKFHNKTRNGCYNCKRRRIRCPEERPACRPCVRQNHKCVYPAQNVDLDVRRLDSGQLVVIPHVSCQVLPSHFDSSRISFFIENTVPVLSSTGPPPKPDFDVASLFVRNDGQSVWLNAFGAFDRMWRLSLLPAAYADSDIFEMVAIFGNRHRVALVNPERSPQLHDYSRMLKLMYRLAIKGSPEHALLGSWTVFAYERLQSASTGAPPLDSHWVHWVAAHRLMHANYATKLLVENVREMLDFPEEAMDFFKTKANTTKPPKRDLLIPSAFENCFQARDTFFHILEHASNPMITRKLLNAWESAMLLLYDKVRGEDWNQSKRTLNLLMEYQLMRTLFELAARSDLQPLRMAAQEVPETMYSPMSSQLSSSTPLHFNIGDDQ